MGRPSHEESFRTLVGVLALAEERESIALTDAAGIMGFPVERLREILEPVLYQEYRTTDHNVIDKTRAFFLDEHDILRVDEEHWLRDLTAQPPGPDTALRLLVAGTVMRSFATAPMPDLDSALRKLEQQVATDVIVAVDAPTSLPVADRAYREAHTLRFRYTNDRRETSDREVEPWFVFSNWGRWYVNGRDLADDAVKWFRVDRMTESRLGDRTFTVPETVEVPDWFDLSERQLTVRLQLTPEAIDLLPTPRHVDLLRGLPNDRLECDVTVFGQQRLEHLLVVLPPDTHVVSPPEHATLRREHAERLLARYTT